MPTALPLLILLSSVAAPHRHAPAHHPYARPHHLRTLGPGPKLVAPKAPQSPGAAKAAEHDDEEAVESVEVVEAVEVTPPTPAELKAANAGVNPLTRGVDKDDHVFGVAPDMSAKFTTAAGAGALVGHLHAALVHLPIAWVLLWAILEFLTFVMAASTLQSSALFIGLMTTASFLPAALSGLCRLDELTSATKGYDTAEAVLHRNLIFVGAALALGCLVLRLIQWRWPNRLCRVLTLLGVISACAITGYSAHLGGRLVYGADFLPF